MVSNIVYFHPDPWGNDPIWRICTYFWNGLKPPPTSSHPCNWWKTPWLVNHFKIPGYQGLVKFSQVVRTAILWPSKWSPTKRWFSTEIVIKTMSKGLNLLGFASKAMMINIFEVVVSNIFYFSPLCGETIQFDYIFFQMGWNHQLDDD